MNQNKPSFSGPQMNVNSCLTEDYNNNQRTINRLQQIMQNKPNFRKSQINVNKVLTKDYENETLGEHGKNKPNSNPIKPKTKPIKPKTNPIQSQSNPKQTQFQSHCFYACFDFLLWDVIRSKLCSITSLSFSFHTYRTYSVILSKVSHNPAGSQDNDISLSQSIGLANPVINIHQFSKFCRIIL